MELTDILCSEGKKITVTPKDGTGAYSGVVRSVHELGVTVWLDGKKKEDGEIRTANLIGPNADATAEIK